MSTPCRGPYHSWWISCEANGDRELDEWAKEVLEYESAFLSGRAIPDTWYASRKVATPPILNVQLAPRSARARGDGSARAR